MENEVILSSDSHVFEPPDLWATRIDKKFRERAPYILRVGDHDRLMVEGDEKIGDIGLISGAGTRFETPEKITHEGRLEDVDRGGYDPEEHIKDMELDGVSGELLYPSQGLFLFKIQDPDLLSAVFRAYNDWLAEFCGHYPDRLKGMALVNLDDVQDGIRELERTAKMGLAGAMLTEWPGPGLEYFDPRYEPFWAAAQDLGMPLSMHTASARVGGHRVGLDGTVRAATARANKVYWVMSSLANMIYSGVFERYPRLKVAIVEFEVAWAPHFIRMLDYGYRERQQEAIYRFKGNVLPSDFFRDNVYISFQEDEAGIMMRHFIGVDNLMWGSDYPHVESTFPRSREILDRILEGVPQEERTKIVGGNAARLYGFDLERIAYRP